MISSPNRNASPKRTSSFNEEISDDIVCEAWLSEINMQQYTETFLVNLSKDNKIISRRRLGQMRQQDLSKMNITNFVHQKVLFEHIKHVLKHPFNSPLRKREVKSKKNLLTELKQIPALKLPEFKKNKDLQPKDKITPSRKHARRRRSFDVNVWQSISDLRTKQAAQASAAENLREGVFANDAGKPKSPTKKSTDRRRRRSLGQEDIEPLSISNSSAMEKAIKYGNMAQDYDIMLSNLDTLQSEFLNKFKNMINCELASIFFVNDRTKDLLLYANTKSWYRIAHGVGIAGHCAETGLTLNIQDAYSDPRFNSALDIRTGNKTRNILCQVVRNQHGSGNVIGVIEMMNKIGADGFDQQDEQILATCAQKVAVCLHDRFNDLLKHAEKFSGNAIFVGGSDDLTASMKKAQAKYGKNSINTVGSNNNSVAGGSSIELKQDSKADSKAESK